MESSKASPESEAVFLIQKEEWIQDLASLVTESLGIDSDLATSAVRWASLWIDDFNLAMQETPAADQDQLETILFKTNKSAFEKAETLSRDSNGLPSAKAVVVARESFLISFKDMAFREQLRDLLSAAE